MPTSSIPTLINTDFFVETKDHYEKLMLGRCRRIRGYRPVNVLGGAMSSLSAPMTTAVTTVIRGRSPRTALKRVSYTDAQQLRRRRRQHHHLRPAAEKIYAFHDLAVTRKASIPRLRTGKGELWSITGRHSDSKDGRRPCFPARITAQSDLYFFTLPVNCNNEAVKFTGLLPGRQGDWIRGAGT